MKATSFKETNIVLDAGNNPNTDQLPICIAEDKETPGVVFCVSKYKMSPEEREHFLEKGEVWLAVMANVDQPTQPPVMLTAFNPFEHFGFRALDIIP